MTEALSPTSAEQFETPNTASRMLGASAVGNLGKEKFTEITMADLVDLRSKRLLGEFNDLETEFKPKQREQEAEARKRGKTPSPDQLATPRLIQRFVHAKVEQMKIELPEGSAFKTSIKTIPVGMVLDRVSSLRRERDSIVETSKRPAYMRAQTREAMPIAATNADKYPQLHFLGLLRKEFQDSGNPKYAIYTTELIIATARTINSILNRPDAEQSESTPQ
ncbi:MAG: hypothetical protein ABIR37_04630 [Candidatus Saccharimonadales bacterium]